MPNNQFKKGELYSFITGIASTAIARRLQKKFNAAGLKLTIEQWSVLYQLWKKDGMSQQELCLATFRDKPSITRLVDNLEKLQMVKRVPSPADRRINLIDRNGHRGKRWRQRNRTRPNPMRGKVFEQFSNGSSQAGCSGTVHAGRFC